MKIFYYIFVSLFIFALTVLSADPISQQEARTVLNLIQSKNFDSAYIRINFDKNSNSESPELFVLLANYYYMKSIDSGVILKSRTITHDTILDPRNAVSDEQADQMERSSEINYDTLRMGLTVLREGIRKYPNRLDLHFGLVYLAESSGLYKDMTSALLVIMEMSAKPATQWLWSFSEQLKENPDTFVLENVQQRVYILFHYTSDINDSLLTIISKAMISYYPHSVYGYTNLGALYNATAQYSEAMPYLLKANEIDSNDVIVLVNLAQVSEKIGDTLKACDWYRKIVAIDSSDNRNYAQKKLSELKK